MTADGFFRTGDVGYMDEDGFVYIVDRTKDMLLCGGFNVYPRNIEEAIYQHPSVEEVSVIGVPDAYRGETPKAFVKLKAGAPALTFDGHEGVPEGPARQARDDRRDGDPRRTAQDPGRQDLEEGPSRLGRAGPRRLTTGTAIRVFARLAADFDGYTLLHMSIRAESVMHVADRQSVSGAEAMMIFIGFFR